MNIETRVRKIRNVLGDAVVQGTFKKPAQVELEKCLRRMDELKAELAQYENLFQMSSQEAWDMYQNGKLGDSADVMEWMMLFENYRAFQGQAERIREVDSQ
ncbi:MAG: hypothetical protein KAJ90_03740 [Desulfobacterales bacterium]|nr:hypothetical protein [Desulfobacterales bacterium]